MRWITRQFAKVDRIACPWLIRRFIDPAAEFAFLPPDTNWKAVKDGIVFDVPGCELGHHGRNAPLMRSSASTNSPILPSRTRQNRACRRHARQVVCSGGHRPRGGRRGLSSDCPGRPRESGATVPGLRRPVRLLSRPRMSDGLTIERLSLRRAGRAVLEDVSVQVEPGEIVAVIGPNGSGKTSLLESVVGFLPITAGRVAYLGRALERLADCARVFSFLPEAAEPPCEVRVSTILCHAERYGRPRPGLSANLARHLGLDGLADAFAGELSKGEKRRLALFGALCSERPIAVLDEPLGVFDPLQLFDVVALLRERANQGLSLLISVHRSPMRRSSLRGFSFSTVDVPSRLGPSTTFGALRVSGVEIWRRSSWRC